jgi:proteasome assembly chaperone (PAC2) family protein
MLDDIIIKNVALMELKDPVAVVGSPGLRSIGKLAVDQLITQTKAQPLADLYSTHLPTIYQTQPSYAADPSLPGIGGAVVEAGTVDLPRVQLFASVEPPLILVRGYHANFEGQFTVAKKTVDLLAEAGVRRMIAVAGFGTTEKKLCVAANTQALLDEMKAKWSLGTGYKGPFMGFSGLVFGLAKLRGIEAVCLFAGTQPVEEDLEYPDNEASARAVAQLNKIIGLKPL